MEDAFAGAAAGGARRGAGGRSLDTGEERDGGSPRAQAHCCLRDSAGTHLLCIAHSSPGPFPPGFPQILNSTHPFFRIYFCFAALPPCMPGVLYAYSLGVVLTSLHLPPGPWTSVHPPYLSRPLQDPPPPPPGLQPMQFWLHPGRS